MDERAIVSQSGVMFEGFQWRRVSSWQKARRWEEPIVMRVCCDGQFVGYEGSYLIPSSYKRTSQYSKA